MPTKIVDVAGSPPPESAVQETSSSEHSRSTDAVPVIAILTEVAMDPNIGQVTADAPVVVWALASVRDCQIGSADE